MESIPVQEAKAALKTASFMLAKSSDVSLGQLPAELIEAADNIATYHATTLGAVLSALLVPVLSTDLTDFWNDSQKKNAAKGTRNGRGKIERVEAPLIERNTAYKKYAGDSKDADGTTLLVVPTQAEADEWAAFFKSSKTAVLVLSGKLTGERREAALARIPTFKGLVISTPGFAWVPIPNLDRIIIERISAGSYAFPKRPYLDLRFALTELARVRNVPIVYGDYPLPLEYRKNPEAPIEKVALSAIELVDVRTEKTEVKKASTAWKAVPDILREQIRKTLDADGRVAVLAVRRGYSPTVVCRDCGTAVTDEHGRALSLATINGKRVFRSTDGSVSQSAEIFCKVCGGWNLTPLGIGIERVEEELREAFPKTPIIRIDQDTRSVVSLKKARAEITAPGTIIIGTEMMLPFLSPYEPVDLGIIASADSLLALPFWRSRERFVRVGRMLAERSKHTLIATRHPEDAALTALTNPLDTSFWKEETNLRKILAYPPFGTLIVFHIAENVAASDTRLEEARSAIRTACLPHIPHELSSSLVLQLPTGVWPDAKLSARLAQLSPSIRIQINSENLL